MFMPFLLIMANSTVATETPDAPSDVEVRQTGSRDVQITWKEAYSGNSAITRYTVQCKNFSGEGAVRPCYHRSMVSSLLLLALVLLLFLAIIFLVAFSFNFLFFYNSIRLLSITIISNSIIIILLLLAIHLEPVVPPKQR